MHSSSLGRAADSLPCWRLGSWPLPQLPRLALIVVLGALPGCSSTVDCDALCAHTLACEVTFAPSDDPDGQKIVAGERSDAESCALGCAQSTTVTVANANCIDQLEFTGDPALCQDDVLRCLQLGDSIGATP